ncbi:transcriptional regulator GcvA [Rhodovibrionaceae bacterium A322]
MNWSVWRMHLPTMAALRAFEATARHLSFTKAAEELALTQAAVSHQVRTMEDLLGVQVFARYTRRLELNAQGTLLLPFVRKSLQQLRDGLSLLDQSAEDQGLTLSTMPSFSTKWLAPRLAGFWRAYPGVDLRLTHSVSLVNFDRDDVDLAIRYGEGNWPGVISECALPVDRVPVCAPQFMEGEAALTQPADLLNHTLLHMDNRAEWTQWLRSVGVSRRETCAGLVLDDSAILLQLAIDGQGIALGNRSLIADDLRTGRLVIPFPEIQKEDLAYYLVYPPKALEKPAVAAFRDWFMAEALAFQQENELGDM